MKAIHGKTHTGRAGIAAPPAKSRPGSRQRPEKAIQRAILDWLATVPGVMAWKSGSGAFRMSYRDRAGQTRERFVVMGKRGVSDIVGWMQWPQVIAGEDALRLRYGGPMRQSPAIGDWIARFLAIEVKRPGEKPTPDQAAFLEAVQAAGGIGIVATCVDDVASALGGGRRDGGAGR